MTFSLNEFVMHPYACRERQWDIAKSILEERDQIPDWECVVGDAWWDNIIRAELLENSLENSDFEDLICMDLFWRILSEETKSLFKEKREKEFKEAYQGLVLVNSQQEDLFPNYLVMQ